MENDATQIEEHCERLKNWLFQHALPIWEKNGIEQDTGGFFDRLSLDGVRTDRIATCTSSLSTNL